MDQKELFFEFSMLAPYKAAVLPLVAKDGLPEKAREVMDTLKFEFMCQYEEKDSIGRRYRRQDAIGTLMPSPSTIKPSKTILLPSANAILCSKTG